MKSQLKYTKKDIEMQIANISAQNTTFTFSSYSDTNGLSIYFIDTKGNTHRYSDHECSLSKGYIMHSLATGVMGANKVAEAKTMQMHTYINALGVKKVHVITCIN